MILKIGAGDRDLISLVHVDDLTNTKYLFLSWVVGLICWIFWYLRAQLERILLMFTGNLSEEIDRMLVQLQESSGILRFFMILFNGVYLYPVKSLVVWAIVVFVTVVAGRAFVL
jgi:hypothetical protein